MPRNYYYRCSLCKHEYDAEGIQYNCLLDGGNLDLVLDYANIRRLNTPDLIFAGEEPSLWRYLSLLPIDDPGGLNTPFRSAGWTPIYAPAQLRARLGMPWVWIKDESRNPTASFKDRASAVVVARARELKVEIVVTASTGNAGAALAGMAAALGQQAIIFAPRNAPPAKVAQLLVYGAQVMLIEGNYDDAYDLAIRASQEFGWYCRNTGYNPFTLEGKKTAAFEIWEWLFKSRDRNPKMVSPLSQYPLSIFVSVGDGNIISGLHKGFKDLLSLGWIQQIPRLIGVQAEGSAAIANTFFSGTEIIKPVSAKTLADSISVDLPRDGIRAVRAARETNGGFIVVSDESILQALTELGRVGIFAEPAGATAYAGLIKARDIGLIDPDSPVIVINTGSGLKDIKAAMQATREAIIIEPTLEAVKRIIQ